MRRALLPARSFPWRRLLSSVEAQQSPMLALPMLCQSFNQGIAGRQSLSFSRATRFANQLWSHIPCGGGRASICLFHISSFSC